MRESATVVLPTPLAGPAMMKPLLGPCAGRMARSLAILLSPIIKKDQILERNPWQPSGDFQFRARKKFTDIADAEISDGNYVLRNVQQPLELSWFKDTYPPNTDAFAPGRQPSILNDRASAVDICLPNCSSRQNV